MKKGLTILITTFVILFSCVQPVRNANNELTGSVTPEIKKGKDQDLNTFTLDYDFVVKMGQEEDFDKFKTYSFFHLTRNNATIYIDSSMTEYEFGDKLFPIIIVTGDNSFELLFEINDRPNKNYLSRLFIKDNQLSGQDRLPTFEAKPLDINNDGTKEYAGFWDYSQMWGENNNLIAYNPILYYSVTTTGLKLDSVLTIERNEMIYGEFHGFSFSENHEQPTTVLEKFRQELNLINGGL